MRRGAGPGSVESARRSTRRPEQAALDYDSRRFDIEVARSMAPRDVENPAGAPVAPPHGGNHGFLDPWRLHWPSERGGGENLHSRIDGEGVLLGEDRERGLK